MAPDLVDTVTARRRRRRTAAAALSGGSWIQDIAGPLRVKVLMQYIDILLAHSAQPGGTSRPDHMVLVFDS
jgi:hypothetical protein